MALAGFWIVLVIFCRWNMDKWQHFCAMSFYCKSCNLYLHFWEERFPFGCILHPTSSFHSIFYISMPHCSNPEVRMKTQKIGWKILDGTQLPLLSSFQELWNKLSHDIPDLSGEKYLHQSELLVEATGKCPGECLGILWVYVVLCNSQDEGFCKKTYTDFIVFTNAFPWP